MNDNGGEVKGGRKNVMRYVARKRRKNPVMLLVTAFQNQPATSITIDIIYITMPHTVEHAFSPPKLSPNVKSTNQKTVLNRNNA